MKKTIITTILCLATIGIEAQVTARLVTDESEIDDQKVYMLGTAIKSNQLYPVYTFEDRDSKNDEYYQTYLTREEPISIYKLYGNIVILFKITKENGRYLIYDLTNEYYIGTPASSSVVWFGTRATPTEGYYFHFDNHRLALDYAFIGINDNHRLGRWINITDDKTYVCIYELTATGSLVIGDNNGYELTASCNMKNIQIQRTFSANIFNTLMLPFDITNYKAVFGSDANVYGIDEVKDNNIYFKKIDDDDTMLANHPYLIYSPSFDGTIRNYNFSNAVFHIPNTSSKTATYACDDIDFIGSYNVDENAAGKESYILYDNEFRYCKNNTTNIVKPTRWYILDKREAQAKPALWVDGNLETTAMTTPPTKNAPQAETIYNLQGIRMGTDWEVLPKGIYLRSHQKVVKN